jgi:hypothetical protein
MNYDYVKEIWRGRIENLFRYSKKCRSAKGVSVPECGLIIEDGYEEGGADSIEMTAKDIIALCKGEVLLSCSVGGCDIFIRVKPTELEKLSSIISTECKSTTFHDLYRK